MADQWYVGRHDKRSGPFTAAQLRQMALNERLKPTDLLWKEGMASWIYASMVKGLFPHSAVPTPQVVDKSAATIDDDIEFDPPEPQGRVDQAMQYAEYLPRVGAALLDGLFVVLMGCIPATGIIIVFVALFSTANPDAQAGAVAIGNCCSQLVSFFISMTYYVVLETSEKQGTWGKQIVGIKVTDLEGNRITAGRALGRYFAKILSGCTLGIGWLLPLLTEKKQTLHDMIAGCLALRK